jgi:hypothetical protein
MKPPPCSGRSRNLPIYNSKRFIPFIAITVRKGTPRVCIEFLCGWQTGRYGRAEQSRPNRASPKRRPGTGAKACRRGISQRSSESGLCFDLCICPAPKGQTRQGLELMDALKQSDLEEPSTSAYYGILLVAAGEEDRARPTWHGRSGLFAARRKGAAGKSPAGPGSTLRIKLGCGLKKEGPLPGFGAKKQLLRP